MCVICIDFQKDRMSIAEARRALGEMIETLEPRHVDEVRAMLHRAEETEAAASGDDD